jgi:hypothetical protein
MRKLILFIAALAILEPAICQHASPELICSSGGSFGNSTYQIDWSIGELATSVHSAGTYLLTEGFHQGNLTVTAVEDWQKDFKISVFPNPATDYINLNLAGNLNLKGLKYKVTDISGKDKIVNEIQSATQTINCEQFSSGIYFLTILQNNQSIKIFKIIKL